MSVAGRDYGEVLWTPSATVSERAVVTRYAKWLADRGVPASGSYHDLWQWSVTDLAGFWTYSGPSSVEP